MTTQQIIQPQPAVPGLALIPQSYETAGMVLAAEAKALVEARITVALKRPRDIDLTRQKLMREAQRPSFAEAAIYRKPVGQGIEGPSIRFVEQAIAALTNIEVTSPTIYDDAEKRIVRVIVADLETNTSFAQDVTITKTVERNGIRDGDEVLRTRQNKQGKTVYIKKATDDEILNTQGALVSKAVRTLGLRLIPGWLVDEVLDEVRKTRESDAGDPDAAKRKLFDSFAKIGVDAAQLKAYLGHDGAAINARERQELLGLFNALKDGETSWREVMDARAPQTADEKAKGAAGGAAEKVKEHIAKQQGVTK